MTKPKSSRRTRLWICGLIAAPFLLLGVSLLLDLIPLSRARPPKDMNTIDDFRTWKGDAIIGKGTFESGGEEYTVMLGSPGRYLASGPSAYVFEEEGEFVDWTSDMGDVRTEEHDFDLTSGHVKDVEMRP